MTTQTATQHPIRRELNDTISLSLPLMGSWLIYSLSGFIGTAMVAHLGRDALAASVLINTLWMATCVFFFGILNAISVAVSHQYGARNDEAISEIIGQSFLIAFAALIPITIIVCLFPWILHFTSQSDSVLVLAKQYAYALLLSAPGLMVLVMLEHFLNGIGRTKLSLMISLIEVPIEILLIYVFVFGKCGLPAFGIAGVGYGLATSFTLTTIVLLTYLNKARFAKRYHIFKHIGTIHPGHLKELLRIGLPVGIMYMIEVSAFSMATFFMAHFSTVILAAHQIAMQYLGLTINAAYAIAQAVSIRIGHNVGRNDVQGVRYAAYVGMALSAIFMGLISLFYILFPHLLLRIDINVHDPANALLVKTATALIIALGVFQLFDSVRIIASGALRGLKETRTSMYVSFISFWLIGVGSAYFFGFTLHGQGLGVWTGMIVGVAVGAIILLLRLRLELNKGIKDPNAF